MQPMDRKAERLNRCPDAQALLPAFVEGELSANERLRVEGHLNICASCRKEEGEFRRALGILKNAPRQESPGDLYYGFVAKLEASERRSRTLRGRLRYAGAAACLLLVVGVSASPLIQSLTRKEVKHLEQPVANKVAINPPSSEPFKAAPATIPTEPGNITKRLDQPPEQKDEQKAAGDNSSDTIRKSGGEAPAPKHKSKQRKIDDTDFWHIQPEQGLSVADVMTARDKSANQRGPDSTGETMTPKDHELRARNAGEMAYTPDRYERVQVGGMETTIKTGYRLDDEGRKKSIHIEIGTSQEK